MNTAQRIALDAIDQAFGVKLEAHQVLAMAVTLELKKYTPTSLWETFRDLRVSDRWSWEKVLAAAYTEAKGRRRSRAQRAGRACGRAAYPHGHHHGMGPADTFPRRCCRWAGHEGRCESR